LQTGFGELGSFLVFALRQDADDLNDVGLIVFDEGHMIGVGSRDIRSEVLIQRLLRRGDVAGRRIVCLSAMFTPGDPYFKDFGDWLRSDAPGEAVNVQWRPMREPWRRSIGALEAIPECSRFLMAKSLLCPASSNGASQKTSAQNPFPMGELEFCICAANAFAGTGYTVLG
jgi:hypothetical protein